MEKKPYKPDYFSEPVLLFEDEVQKDQYADKHKKTKYLLGVMVVCLFRFSPEEDHTRLFFDEHESFVWGREEELTWTSGIALSAYRERVLRTANRSKGSFYDNHGWWPMVNVKAEPTIEEREMYILREELNLDYEWQHYFDED